MWRDAETDVDLLEFDYLSSTIKMIIEDESLTPSTIGIYGDWGSGKSSLMNMVENEFQNIDGQMPNDILCIKFNSWLFEGYEDAKTALLNTILDEIKKKTTNTDKFKGNIKKIWSNLKSNVDWFKVLSRIAVTGADIYTTGGLFTMLNLPKEKMANFLKERGHNIKEEDIDDFLKILSTGKEVIDEIKSFRDNFETLLNETNLKHIIIFIDELDRCSTDTILDTFEAMRLFVFVKKSSFIIGADERHIQYAIKTKYPKIDGNNMDIGKEYLEKIIQYPIYIPALSPDKMSEYMVLLMIEKEMPDSYERIKKTINEKKLNENIVSYKFSDLEIAELKDNETYLSISKIASVLCSYINGNPRHCKRFLNTVYMRYSMAKKRNIELEIAMLSKLMILEYYMPQIYQFLADAAYSKKYNGIILDLSDFEQEEENINENNIFIQWKEDIQFREWSKLKPNICDRDIRKYIYFSRDKLSFKNILSYSDLSVEATECLKLLISPSDITKNKGLHEANKLIPKELIAVHKLVAENLIEDMKLDENKLELFLNLSKNHPNLETATMHYLRRISIAKINYPHIPHIGEYIKQSKNKENNKELLHEISKKSKGMKDTIQEYLNE